jgi:hypothetical protein
MPALWARMATCPQQVPQQSRTRAPLSILQALSPLQVAGQALDEVAAAYMAFMAAPSAELRRPLERLVASSPSPAAHLALAKVSPSVLGRLSRLSKDAQGSSSAAGLYKSKQSGR